MGVLTDLIVADPAQAKEICQTHGKKPFPSVDIKGFDQIKGATLWSILEGSDVSDVDYVVGLSEKFTLLCEESDDGPWVYQVPDEFLKLIASTEDEAVGEMVEAWSQTEEFDGYSLEDVQFYFDTLFEAATRSDLGSKKLLMWICL
ncbi:MAG: hypothetical protein KIS92_01425 [Planctomycetota bacterium]|nr:hypothetical protein [Planctomycetota bacterium]